MNATGAAVNASGYGSEVRWIGELNGTPSVALPNASMAYYIVIHAPTDRHYELRVHHLLAGAADDDSDGFAAATEISADRRTALLCRTLVPVASCDLHSGSGGKVTIRFPD